MNLGKLLSLGLLLCVSTFAAQPLQVRVNCMSMLIRPADLKVLGITYHNEIGLYDLDIRNGELALAPSDIDYTHWGQFFYTDPTTGETYGMDFVLDLPAHDANNTGNFDLLEYEMSDSGRTIGQYMDPDGTIGSFKADWSKAANSMTGTVKITFDFMGTSAFVHQFEIMNYSGQIASYARDGAKITAPITLTRMGNPSQTLTGPLVMNADAVDKVSLVSTNFTNEAGVGWNWFAPEVFERDGHEYWQFLGVIDGTPPDQPEDFNTWLLDIIDPNDTDGDAIPDLSDFTPPAIPQPTMEIIKTTDGVRVLVHGQIGRTYTFQSSPTVSSTSWFDFLEFTLNADPKVIDIQTTEAAEFYRLRTP